MTIAVAVGDRLVFQSSAAFLISADASMYDAVAAIETYKFGEEQ